MASTRYAPVELVVTVRVSAVASFVILTSALAITAPLLSRTTPAKIPLLVCALPGCIASSSRHSIRTHEPARNALPSLCLEPSQSFTFILESPYLLFPNLRRQTVSADAHLGVHCCTYNTPKLSP